MDIRYRADGLALAFGNCKSVLKEIPDNMFDSIVTDPPYELNFMGRKWDNTGIAYDAEMWAECERVLKPGGHIIAATASRTYHRIAVAIEDAGFEIRDQIDWVYGSGFPKGQNVSKLIDKKLGGTREVLSTSVVKGDKGNGNTLGTGWGTITEITLPATPEALQWDGWNTQIKPAHEPMVLARKRTTLSTVDNVLKYGVGGINVDACRTSEIPPSVPQFAFGTKDPEIFGFATGTGRNGEMSQADQGRWPTNMVFSHAEDCTEDLCDVYCPIPGLNGNENFFNVFRYQKKANSKERPKIILEDGTSISHATVKPLDLMRWLVRMVTPPGGLCLDPFGGSGTTGEACKLEGFKNISIELEEKHLPLILQRWTR